MERTLPTASFPLGRGSTRAAVVAALMSVVAVVVAGCDENKALPDEKAEVVVGKFYEFISQARLRGGTLLLREAYKLIDSERSRLSQARFIQVVQKYPSGFQAKVVEAHTAESHADVTIEYTVGSMFGDGYTVRSIVPLNVDEATNTWKIDFTGETDSQNLKAVKDSIK